MKPKKRVILVIRDGWGYRKSCKDNAICQTKTPHTDKLMSQYPNVLIKASGEAVGLEKGYQGNSEVGHTTIGSGRIVLQSLVRINKSIKDRTFFRIPQFLEAIENCRKNKTSMHLIGLLQVEGVHSHMNHLLALLDLCKKQNFRDVYIHVITDGRDAPVTDSKKHIKTLIQKLKKLGLGRIATISGRYYTMDRDKRWSRTKKAYQCIVKAKCKEEFDYALKQIVKCHKRNETDEFIVPKKAKWYKGIKPRDSIIFYNFRTERPRQFTKAIVEEKFEGWSRKPLNVFYVAMTQYYKNMNAKVAFKNQGIRNLLGEVIASNNLKQLRISETEKYAHITFFFNDQKEAPLKNEDRIMVHSPTVPTYDLKPEMSVYEVTAKLVKNISTEKYDVIINNLVNGDMVGHTGNSKAISKAVRAVDECVGKIVKAGLQHDYVVFIFGDHGNAEDQTPKWRTSHTTNPVPFILVSDDEILKNCKLKKNKGLQDVAPTALDIIGIKKPKEMTGTSLIAN